MDPSAVDPGLLALAAKNPIVAILVFILYLELKGKLLRHVYGLLRATAQRSGATNMDVERESKAPLGSPLYADAPPPPAPPAPPRSVTPALVILSLGVVLAGCCSAVAGPAGRIARAARTVSLVATAMASGAVSTAVAPDLAAVASELATGAADLERAAQ